MTDATLELLSLRRSEMFIATSAKPKDLAPSGAKSAVEQSAWDARVLRSLYLVFGPDHSIFSLPRENAPGRERKSSLVRS
jgi:hypothetical protein